MAKATTQMSTFHFKMKIKVQEVDDEGFVEDEYDDEYQIDPIKIKISDLMDKQDLAQGKFMNAWS